MYVEHVTNLVRSLNTEGVVPRIQDSWSLLARAQHTEQLLRIQTTVFERVSTDCPVGTRETVRAWVETVVHEAFAATSFLDPPPDAGVRERQVTAALEEAHRVGRVLTRWQQANEVRTHHVARFQDTRNPLDLVPPESVEETVRHMAAYMILQESGRVILDAGVALGREDVTRTLELDMERMRHENETLRCTTASASVQHADATTMTDVDEGVTTDATTDAQHERMIVDLRACLETADTRATDAEREVDTIRRREETTVAAFEDSMETLRSECVTRISECEAQVETSQEEVRVARVQRDTLASEVERLRSLTTEAQERTTEVHRSTLDEIRRRDTEVRDLLETQSELRVREELTSNENRTPGMESGRTSCGQRGASANAGAPDGGTRTGGRRV